MAKFIGIWGAELVGNDCECLCLPTPTPPPPSNDVDCSECVCVEGYPGYEDGVNGTYCIEAYYGIACDYQHIDGGYYILYQNGRWELGDDFNNLLAYSEPADLDSPELAGTWVVVGTNDEVSISVTEGPCENDIEL